MNNESKLFKYIFLNDIGSLSKKERVMIIFIPSFFISVMLLFIFIQSYDFSILALLFSFYVFFIGLAHPLFYFERYDEKYGFYSKIRFGGTYQMMSKNLSLIIPGMILIILTLGWILDNVTIGILISFAFVLPFLALFFRLNVFNDESSIEGEEIILGYHPTYYGLISLIVGIYGYLKVYILLNHDFNLAIIIFCITALFQIMFLIPDKINKGIVNNSYND